MTARNALYIDAAGAVVSASMLTWVLPIYSDTVGMPRSVCYLLGIAPIVFVFWDFAHAFRATASHARALKIVAYGNLTYCLLSLMAAAAHTSTLTQIGWAYFVGEIVVVAALAKWELRIAAST